MSFESEIKNENNIESEMENNIINLLAIVYGKIQWHKMRTSKNPHDIFNHRVRAASRRSNLYESISRLCNYFGLQSIPQNAITYIDNLKKYEDKVLYKLENEHIPICLKAILLSKEFKKAKKEMQYDLEV